MAVLATTDERFAWNFHQVLSGNAISVGFPGSIGHIADEHGIALYGIANNYDVSAGLTVFKYFLRCCDAAAYE